jgi:hypothetical protein
MVGGVGADLDEEFAALNSACARRQVKEFAKTAIVVVLTLGTLWTIFATGIHALADVSATYQTEMHRVR